MIILQIPVGHMQNFAYIIADEESKKAFVIDPGFEADKIIQEAEENDLKIEKILLTHFHYDHSKEAQKLANKTGAEIYGHQRGKEKINKQDKGMWIIPEKFTKLEDGEKIKLEDLEAEAVFTPGHQNDHLCFIIGNNIFTGDALFVDTIGRTDLPDSDHLKMEETLKYFKTLADDMIVYPGHDYGVEPFRTIGEEKKANRFLK